MEKQVLDRNKSKNILKGQLKIFFGYTSGVGKTYAMLKAAHKAKDRGIDVVVGVVNTHEDPLLLSLLEGLECLSYNDQKNSHEFDLDQAIKRKPKLLLIDDLAHINAKGCRHNKRYQDVKELLNTGIDVYTTVDVSNIESLNDMVFTITHQKMEERIPDSVFDNAQQVELVDIDPQELIERFSNTSIASMEVFTLEKLTALRELALRRCADRMTLLSENARMNYKLGYYTDEHILVCLSSAPSNAKIIRTAARMAYAFKGAFSALYVETPEYAQMSEEDKDRLRSNIHLAQQLGAEIEWVYGEDVSYQIAEFARLFRVTTLVIGRSQAANKKMFSKSSLTEKLLIYAPNLDTHIIPDNVQPAFHPRLKKTAFELSLRDLLICAIILLLATLLSVIFSRLGFTEANIFTVYILAVLIISLITVHLSYALMASIVSVLIFNYFFAVPTFSFAAYNQGYPISFIAMFIFALITGSSSRRLKERTKYAIESAYRTKALFDTSQLLQHAKNSDEILQATASQLIKLLDRDVFIYLNNNDELSEPHIYKKNEESPNFEELCTSEKNIAEWVLKNNKLAGAATETFSEAKCLYLAIRTINHVYGVIGIVIQNEPLEALENSILLSILTECALTLENQKNAREKEEAAILAKNEQLRANLLRAISHDLRTPLTSISGNASNLLSNGEEFDEDMKHHIYTDIYEDAMWLINLVENLLSVSRIEEGHMNLHMQAELMEEVVGEALRHVSKSNHPITTSFSDEFILAKIDAKLIVQVIINIVDNAIKYTPEGTSIEIKCEKAGKKVLVSIADTGQGIPDEIKPRIFDMFYSGANKVADSRRSMGLGLSLCKLIINLHGEEIQVTDNQPHGSIFSFTLPAEEVVLYE